MANYSVKRYKKDFVFLMAWTLKDKLFPKDSKVVFTIAYLKAMPRFIPVLSSILELSRLVRNFLAP